MAFLIKDPTFVNDDKAYNQRSEVCLSSLKQEAKNRKNAQTLFLRRAVDRFSSIE